MRLTWSILHSRSERAATSSERRQPDGWGSGKILLLMELTIALIIVFYIVFYLLRPTSKEELKRFNKKDNWSNMGF